MPHCPSEERLERYLAGDGPGDERATIDTHLETCDSCRDWLVEARADEALLGGVRVALAEAVPGGDGARCGGSSSADGPVLRGGGAARGAPAVLPERIAGYRVRGLLGEGGMGVVYAAEQEHPRREVALKVIRGNQQLDPHRLRLFRREADALARLRHVGIAAIHDAGCTPDGRHYFVMERVHGVALDGWVRRARPGLRERIELFVRICDAVSYAHQRGVIHRDLKPGNILVDGDGLAGAERDSAAVSAATGRAPAALPKILDFGLARITDEDLGAATVVTEIGKIQGTLAYMSPEQARGLTHELDVRSDVYALGVILFELLTGERPYAVSRTHVPEAIRIICETPPRRPGSIARAVRGELETIMLKALEKSPERRYSGAAELRDDLQRYLHNQPILARPPSAAYQLRKLIARHRLPAALCALLLLTICGFAAWATVQYRVAEALRVAAQQGEARAAAKAATAEEIQRFLQSILVSVDPDEARGRDTTILQELLRDAAARVERQLADEPEVAAAIRITIGNTYANLGQLDRAEPQLRAAAALRERVFGPGSLELAEVLIDLGRLLRIRERYDDGEALLRRALAIRRAVLGGEHLAVAEALNNLGTLLTARGRTEEAAPLFEQAIALHTRVRGADDLEMATALSNLGLCYFRLGRLDHAEDLLRRALAIRRTLRPGGDAGTAMVLSNLCTLLIHFRQDRDAAIELQREACAIRRRLLPPDHPDLIDSLRNLGTSLTAIDRDLEAVPVYYEAIERQRALRQRRDAGADSAAALEAARELLGLEYELGAALMKLGLYDEAEPHVRFAAENRIGVVPADRPACANFALVHGICQMRLGLLVEAEPLLLEAYAWHVQRSGPKAADTARAASALAELYDAWGRAGDADVYRGHAAAAPR